MNSTTYYIIAAVIGGLGTLLVTGLVTVFTVLGHYAKQRETQATASQQESDRKEILSEIRTLGLNENDLWKRYPFGYIVYGGKDNDLSRLVLPLFNRGDIYPDADWKDTKIKLDPAKKTFEITLVTLRWKAPDGSLVPGYGPNVAAIIQSGSYTLGKPVLATVVSTVPGQPNVYLEVIDDTPNHQICVIGFKKLSPDWQRTETANPNE
jgi:hypothetical protein